MRNQYGLRVWTSMQKTLDNNDLNRAGGPAVLVKRRVWATVGLGGVLSLAGS